jgi:hypothetical protein
MPIPIVAGKPRRVQAHHEAGFAKADLGNQRLKAVPVSARRPGLAKIVINDVNSLAWPAEHGGSLDQPILQLRAFLMMTDLPGR